MNDQDEQPARYARTRGGSAYHAKRIKNIERSMVGKPNTYHAPPKTFFLWCGTPYGRVRQVMTLSAMDRRDPFNSGLIGLDGSFRNLRGLAELQAAYAEA